jgi:hypothetical protein
MLRVIVDLAKLLDGVFGIEGLASVEICKCE